MVIPAYFRINLDYNAKLIYDARGEQMNLPPSMSKNLGARVVRYEVWRKLAIEYNRFLGKIWKRISSKNGIDKSVDEIDEEFRTRISIK